jgi:hypothetical protein
MLRKEIISVYTENHMESQSKLCGQNTELLNFKIRGTYNYH